jgi:hypothetical protein
LCLLKATLLYGHDNDHGCWQTESKLSMARDMGMNMWGEYYAHTAGPTTIGAEQLKPKAWEEIAGDRSSPRIKHQR